MSILNLGILAHVDAGKTSLTERLLYDAGVIDRVGSVDDGSTQTDTLALERQRGITIRSAVVSFAIGDVTVNLIDTPGHPDFIAEVERVLSVLDGAVLVISAVEGVQAQTRLLLRTLRRLRIPTLIFVNKIDRTGARDAGVLREIAARLTPAVVGMASVTGLGTRDAAVVPAGPTDARFTARLAELLAEHDDALLAAYVDGPPPAYDRLRAALAAQTRAALVHPVFFGSAITGAGVAELAAGVTAYLPRAGGDPDAPAAGAVFKVERGAAGEKIAYVRLFDGTVRVRDRLDGGKVTAIAVFDRGGAARAPAVSAGRIGKLWGLAGVRIGDRIGTPDRPAPSGHFAPPTLETVVVPDRPAARGALYQALSQLAEQDPLIDVRRELSGSLSVSLYGEVQKEVIQATLAEEFGLAVTFRRTTTVCVERLVHDGEAVEVIGVEPNPFLATVGLRVAPAPVGAGVRFQLGVELGSMPPAFFRAVEETVRETLHQGLYGWEVPDCVVTMTHAGYWARQSHAHAVFDASMSSTAGDFRHLTPLVLMAALRRAGTRVYAPVHRFHLEIPTDTYGTVAPALARLGAVPRAAAVRGAVHLVEGDVPDAAVHGLEQRLPGLTRGEAVLECRFDRYERVHGPAPRRPRWDYDPLNRREYLLRVVRRVQAR